MQGPAVLMLETMVKMILIPQKKVSPTPRVKVQTDLVLPVLRRRKLSISP